MGTNMSQYKHRITLVVPEDYIDHANQLALIMGESSVDIRTFTIADWQDADGNLYAVCSALSKPIVLGALTKGLPVPLPSHATNANVAKAQQALDMIVQYEVGVMASVDKIVLAVDTHPHDTFESAGIFMESEEELDNES